MGRRWVGELDLGEEFPGLLEEQLFGFHMVGVGQATLNGAFNLAHGPVVETDALYAPFRIDDADGMLHILGDRLRGAALFAGTAIDTIVRNYYAHRAEYRASPAKGQFL